MSIRDLKIEYGHNGGFVGVPTPRISWKTETGTRGWRQSLAELRLDDKEALIPGARSHFVDWPFDPLRHEEFHELRVRVSGEDGSTSDWSPPIQVTLVAYSPRNWRPRMVGGPSSAGEQPLLVRGSFTLDRPIERVLIAATAHGVYQASINGIDIDDQILKPGWHSYSHRSTIEVTDITHLVVPGKNAIGLALAGGWYTERYGIFDRQQLYGGVPRVAAQIDIHYANGDRVSVVTDETWHYTLNGPIVSSGIYEGERFDARRLIPEWNSARFDDSDWPCVEAEGMQALPTLRLGPPVRCVEELPAQTVSISSSGATIVDFGQNIAGVVRLRVRGQCGTTIRIRHAEILEDGELVTRPLRTAAATDYFTCAGTGEETWQPQFTYHGFRYAEFSGLPDDFDPQDFVALVIHSDMERTGTFHCSDELVNRLYANVVWSMRSNFVYLPTDCPQRDERLGWTGDIQVFAATAGFIYDTNGFLASWLDDLAAEQIALEGVVPPVVPNVLPKMSVAAAGWGDAATVLPWDLNVRFGDHHRLRQQLPSMCRWVEYVLGTVGRSGLWEDRFQFGDWLDPDAPAGEPGASKTDPDVVATAYLYHSIRIVADAAHELGESAKANRYTSIAANIRAAFIREYVASSGRIVSDTPTAYSLAIRFGLFEDEQQKNRMGDRLAFLVRANAYRMSTGFLGTPQILHALVETNHQSAAERLLLQRESPSWLYPVTMGASTIWERWDSLRQDGTINPGAMTSFNHYALGAVADWLHTQLAGLRIVSAESRTFHVSPTITSTISSACAALETPYGRIESRWSKKSNGEVELTVVVPPNCVAIVRPGARDSVEVGSGEHSWSWLPQLPPQPAVSSRSSAAAIIDDQAAFLSLQSVLNSVDRSLAKEFLSSIRWTPGRSLNEFAFRLPQEARGRIIAALAAFSNRKQLED